MTQTQTPRFVSIAELVRMLSVPGRKPGLTAHTIRTLIHRRHKNGLEAYVWRSAPTRWLIDIDGFLRWLRAGTEALDHEDRAMIADFWRTLNKALHPGESTGRTVIPLSAARATKERARVNCEEDL